MFWERFEGLCASVGKAPNNVASELKIPSGSITAWSNGTVPRNKTILKIANYFGVSVDYLSGNDTKKEPATNGDEHSKEDLELLDSFHAADATTQAAIRLLLSNSKEGK